MKVLGGRGNHSPGVARYVQLYCTLDMKNWFVVHPNCFRGRVEVWNDILAAVCLSAVGLVNLKDLKWNVFRCHADTASFEREQ